MNTPPLTQQILTQMAEKLSYLKGLEIPPKVFLDMEGEFIAFEEGKSLTARFPVKERYQNPLGQMQGGVIVAAIDNTFGPLSYLVAPPSLTMTLNTTYVRAVEPEDAYIDVEARVDEHTRRHLFMSARVINPTGELIALSQASCLILRGGPRRS